MMKMIKILTILLALLVSASFVVFGQDGQNVGAVEKAAEDLKTEQADIIATESLKKVKIDQNVEDRTDGPDSNIGNKSSADFKNSINEVLIKFKEFKFKELVLKYKTDIIVSIIGGMILLNIQFIFKIIIKLLLKVFRIIVKSFIVIYSLTACNSYFCKDKFAKQLPKKKKLHKKASSIEKIKNKYIHLQGGGISSCQKYPFPK